MYGPKTKNSPVSQRILTMNRRLSWMVLVAQTFRFDLLFHDFALFCFFILVNVINVYILCFDHSSLIFQFVRALYASASYLRLFLYFL